MKRVGLFVLASVISLSIFASNPNEEKLSKEEVVSKDLVTTCQHYEDQLYFSDCPNGNGQYASVMMQSIAYFDCNTGELLDFTFAFTDLSPFAGGCGSGQLP